MFPDLALYESRSGDLRADYGAPDGKAPLSSLQLQAELRRRLKERNQLTVNAVPMGLEPHPGFSVSAVLWRTARVDTKQAPQASGCLMRGNFVQGGTRKLGGRMSGGRPGA